MNAAFYCISKDNKIFKNLGSEEKERSRAVVRETGFREMCEGLRGRCTRGKMKRYRREKT